MVLRFSARAVSGGAVGRGVCFSVTVALASTDRFGELSWKLTRFGSGCDVRRSCKVLVEGPCDGAAYELEAEVRSRREVASCFRSCFWDFVSDVCDSLLVGRTRSSCCDRCSLRWLAAKELLRCGFSLRSGCGNNRYFGSSTNGGR